MFVNNLSRLVVDPERFEDDEFELMSKRGMGAVYLKTARQEALRRELLTADREKLIAKYYRPYHQAFAGQTKRILDRFGRCLIIDCHSFPSQPLPYEFDRATNRPDICLGTDEFHTPKELVTVIINFCRKNGLNVSVNAPFSGTYVPSPYYKKDKSVRSIMIEVNRAKYMDENTGHRIQEYHSTKKLIDALVKLIGQTAQYFPYQTR